MMDSGKTIVAPASAPGGALVTIRLSGSEALRIADLVFCGKTPLSECATHTAHYGAIKDNDRVIDDVVATLFRAPHSFTGEDSVEFCVHGSRYIVSEIIRLMVSKGAVMASPGEFSARAFASGRIDLSQAEAIADLIASESEASHLMASTQLRGGYSAALSALRGSLLEILTLLELELDFSEEDVEFADRGRLRRMLEETDATVCRLCDSFAVGNAIKRGVNVAIVGAPNVGKSTLLNLLVGEERAMVSEIAGTTRDTVEEAVTIDGICFRFIDTAGLRDSEDRLENMGMERTRKAIENALVVISMAEAISLNFEEINLRPEQKAILVANKSDLYEGKHEDGVIYISARSRAGENELLTALRASVDTKGLYDGDPIVSNLRHFDALSSAHRAIGEAVRTLDGGASQELVAEHIRETISLLGEITGEITNDDVLNSVFRNFCIGK